MYYIYYYIIIIIIIVICGTGSLKSAPEFLVMLLDADFLVRIEYINAWKMINSASGM